MDNQNLVLSICSLPFSNMTSLHLFNCLAAYKKVFLLQKPHLNAVTVGEDFLKAAVSDDV